MPNAVTAEAMADLRRTLDDEQVLDIVAVIASFGCLNRWARSSVVRRSRSRGYDDR